MKLYHFTDLYNLHNIGPDNILAVGVSDPNYRVDTAETVSKF
jgi:hypothetical protein